MAIAPEFLRNVAIIAHIDHGKTTLLDSILKQSGVFRANEVIVERVMDSNDLERERGITIYSKNTSVMYGDYKINIIDTPGHADFSGEVERVLSMVDGVLLLVDAVEGPMPQTRFVLRKSMEQKLKVIVVINKIDRPNPRFDEVLSETLDLFIELGADDDQIDFPVVYASGIDGFATSEPRKKAHTLEYLFQTIVKHIPAPTGKMDAPFCMQVATLEFSDYLGKMACGRILQGTIHPGERIVATSMNDIRADRILPFSGTDIVDIDEETDDSEQVKHIDGKVVKVFGYQGLTRVEMTEMGVGDIVLFSGLDDVNIGDTISGEGLEEHLSFITIDRPTLSVNFCVNDSPFAGREGKFIMMRKIRERLEKELKTNVSLLVEETDSSDALKVSGRGELHLSVLIETMRREGFELAISRPRVILRRVHGVLQEPIEYVRLDLQEEYVGSMMDEMSKRKGELLNMINYGTGLVRLEYHVPTRGLIGLRNILMNVTRGTGILSHQFDKYDTWRGDMNGRSRGVLVAQEPARATAYALGNLQDRAVMFVGPADEVYEGMIVGENTRPDDIVVNVGRAKKLSNMRAAGSDENILLTPPKIMTLEQCLAFIEEDELVEVTPKSIRLRKRELSKEERFQAKKRSQLV